MEADWDEIGRITVQAQDPPHLLATGSTPASAVVFDDYQELLWVGTDQGRLISYYGPQLKLYTQASAHIGEGEVRQVLSCERGIISISRCSVHLTHRRGFTLWHLQGPLMNDLRCMVLLQNPNLLMVAGLQDVFYIIDIEHGAVLEQIPAYNKYVMLRRGRYVCAACDNGSVHVFNSQDYRHPTVLSAHSGQILDIDVRNDILVTCGLSVRANMPSVVDPLAVVYDLRSLRQLPSIPFHAGASHVRLHPRLQTTAIISSNTGQVQVVDVMNPVSARTRQANVQFMVGLEISSSGDAMVINDVSSWVRLWGSPSKIKFNITSQEADFAGSPARDLPQLDWHDQPLNTIGMPYYNDRLLSAWPSHMVFDVGAQPFQPDPNYTSYMQPAEIGHYGTWHNPDKLKRYQAPEKDTNLTPSKLIAPKFLSEQAKDMDHEMLAQVDGPSAALVGLRLNGGPKQPQDLMLVYNNVEIKYSKFGVDDFDFAYFNKTVYAGLETHIKNSYLNSLLQLFRFVVPVRNLAIQHAASACVKPNCLLCEMGFLFDMLEKAEGQNCQATNFLLAFGSLGEARSLGLLETKPVKDRQVLSTMIQSANRFITKQISQDYASIAGSSDGVDETLSTRAMEAIRCLHCGNVTSKVGSTYVHEMLYPSTELKHNQRSHIFKFSSILKASLEREVKHRGFCNKCRRYQQLATRKAIQKVPYVLLLNTALTTPMPNSPWEQPGWLPSEIGVMMQNRGIHVFEGTELQTQLRTKAHNIFVYELVGVVADVDTGHSPAHLVSLINTDLSTPKSAPGRSPNHNSLATNKWSESWHLFNDFLVTDVPRREALSFNAHLNTNWKSPSILAYQLKSIRGYVDAAWQKNVDITLLWQDYSINGIAHIPECEILHMREIPKAGTPIALDTEFVELERPEIDVHSDGRTETIRPARSGLARVSVLRGSGPEEGKPFIDDYITVFDTIVDYKTQYSGIRPGDLDMRMSRHNLVPLKVAYKKLWLLLNLGCVFVGHGLTSDFRKANIHVPKAQTVDTQNLYLLPGKNRRFSLKYLAWAVFQEYIQEDPDPNTNTSDVRDSNGAFNVEGHDSIADARMALRLWRNYQQWEREDVVQQNLEDIYRKGSRYGWKPPNRSTMLNQSLGVNEANCLTGSAVPSGRNTPEMGAATGLAGGGGLVTPKKDIFGSPPHIHSVPHRFSATSATFTPGKVAAGSPLK